MVQARRYIRSWSICFILHLIHNHQSPWRKVFTFILSNNFGLSRLDISIFERFIFFYIPFFWGVCEDLNLCPCAFMLGWSSVCVVRLWCLICWFGSQSNLDQCEVSQNPVRCDVSSVLVCLIDIYIIFQRSDLYYGWSLTVGVNLGNLNCGPFERLKKKKQPRCITMSRVSFHRY